MQLFHFDHVTFIQFKICCCIQNFIEIGWFFTEIWRYNDFQNGGRPPSWHSIPPYEPPTKSLLLAAAARQFHVSLIHRSEDIVIWIFRIFVLKCLFRPQSGGFGGHWTPKCDYDHYRDPQKAHPCVNPRLLSYHPLRGLTCRRVDRKCDGHTHTDAHTGKFIFCPCIALDRQQSRPRQAVEFTLLPICCRFRQQSTFNKVDCVEFSFVASV